MKSLTTLSPILYSFFLIFALLGYFQKYPLPHFLTYVTSILCVSFLFLSFYSIGRFLLDQFLKRESLRWAWYVLYSISLGMGLVGTAVFLLGWAIPGSLDKQLQSLLFFLAIFLLSQGKNIKKIFNSRTSGDSSYSITLVLLWFLLLIGMSLTFLSTATPITYYDSLVYHLALPSYYLQVGAITSVPFNLYSFFPALTEMIFMFILSVFPHPEICINLFLMGLSILVSVGIYEWTRELSNVHFALGSAALWWITPCVILLSVGGYVEIPQALFLILSLRSYTLFRNSKKDAYLYLSGILAGFACAIKYTGAITPILIFSFMIFEKSDLKKKIIHLLKYTGCVLIPFVPWLLKNGIDVGNPFFPFFYKIFGSIESWTTESAEGYFQLLTEYGAKSNLIFDLILSPFRLISDSVSFGGGFDILGDFGWPLFILTAPLAFVFIKSKPKVRFLFVYFIFHFIVWYLTKPVLRFLVNLLPIIVILTTFFLYQLHKKNKFFFRAMLIMALTPFLLSNIHLTLTILNEFQFLRVPLGIESREQYLSRRLGVYPVFQQINIHPLDLKNTLVIGEQRMYHLKSPYISSNYFAPSQISNWSNSSENIQNLEDIFREHNINHIVINEGEINRLGGWERFGFTDQGKTTLSRFLVEKSIQKSNFRGIYHYVMKSL